MSFFSRYFDEVTERDPHDRNITRPRKVPNVLRMARDGFLALVLLILVSSMWPFHVVPTGYRGVVTQFGKIERVEPEGLVVLPPWQRLSNFNTRAETSSVEKAEGATLDTQPAYVSMTVRYAISTGRVAEVFEKYSKDGDLSSYVNSAMLEVFKSVTAKYTAPELITKRAQVSLDIRDALGTALNIYGAHVVKVDMTNFSFHQAYMDAVMDKVTQEQKKLAADNKLKTVESEQKQKVAIAEANAKAVKAEAEGDAYATVTNAKAAADALRMQNAAIRDSKDILELKRIEVAKIEAEKWNGVRVPNVSLGAVALPMQNVGR